MSERIIAAPEVAHIADVLSDGTVVLGLSHIQVGYSGVAFAESVHRKFVSLGCDLHSPFRYHTLLALVVELAYGREHLAAVVVFRLLNLCSDHFLSCLGFLYLSFAQAPVEDRDTE